MAKQQAPTPEEIRAQDWEELFAGAEWCIWGDEPHARTLLADLRDPAEWVARARRDLMNAAHNPALLQEITTVLWWGIGVQTGLTRAGIQYFGGPHILCIRPNRSNRHEVGKSLLRRDEKAKQQEVHLVAA